MHSKTRGKDIPLLSHTFFKIRFSVYFLDSKIYNLL